MTKPTKWHVCPAKTQISLGIRPVWSESWLSLWRNLGTLATHWVHSKDWSDWADAQADLSLRWAHSHFVGFIMRWLKYTFWVSAQFTLQLSIDCFQYKITYALCNWHSNLSIKTTYGSFENCARTYENVSFAICEQQRRRSASLISTFVVRSLDRRTCILATVYIQSFKTLATFCSWVGWF